MNQPIQSELTRTVHDSIPTMDDLDFPITIDHGGYSRTFTFEEFVKYFSIGIYRQVWWSKYSSQLKKETDRRESIIKSILTDDQIEEVNRRLNQ